MTARPSICSIGNRNDRRSTTTPWNMEYGIRCFRASDGGKFVIRQYLKRGRQIDRQNSRKWSCWGNRRRQQWPWGRKGYIKSADQSAVEPSREIGRSGAVGDQGIFTVIKDLGLKEPFSGQTPIVSGELGEDFTYYLAVSEQIPSAVGLSVLVETDDSIRAAGGFMLQIMPGASEEIIDAIENVWENCLEYQSWSMKDNHQKRS